jgi:glycosyltransferase involved in cell wall biosynthesis
VPTVPKARILVTRFPYESQFGGEELHSLKLMESLDGRGVTSFFMGSCPVLLKEFKARHFEVRRAWLGKPPVSKGWLILFTILSPLLWVRAGLLLRWARRKWGVNTVYMHSFGEKLLMTPWALFWNMKVVWVEHARIGKWFVKNPWRRVYERLARRVSVVVTSHAMAEILRPFVPHVLAIPCAALVEKPEPLPDELARFMDSGFSVVCVARLTVDKGVDILVHAVHSKPEMRLVLVGQGPLQARLEKAAKGESVRLLSSLPRGQLMELLKRADVVVLPSREMDPFGMVAAEAMTMGTAVLVTDACGIAKDLRHGEHAWVAAPNFREIDKGIKRLMKDAPLRKKLASAGKRFALEHYDVETMVEAFELILTP